MGKTDRQAGRQSIDKQTRGERNRRTLHFCFFFVTEVEREIGIKKRKSEKDRQTDSQTD